MNEIKAEIKGNQIDLTQRDLAWIRKVSTYLSNGEHFIMPSTFKQWIMQYNGATVMVIKPAGSGNHKETVIKFK